MKPEFRYHPVTFIPVTLIMDNALKDKGKGISTCKQEVYPEIV